MADPTGYSVSYNFSGFQSVNPVSPLPADRLDTEFADVATSISSLRSALINIRRSDGALANNSVGPDQISPALTLGFTLRGAWAEGVEYAGADGVVYDETFYKARLAHTATSGNRPDLDSTTWQVLFTFSALAITDGSIVPSHLDGSQAASFRTVLGLGGLAVEDASYLASSLVAATAKTTPVSADLFEIIDSEALNVRKKMSWASLVAAVKASLGGLPIGAMVPYAGATAPSGWLLCYGQAVSRATYADLFAAIGTVHGSGDGSTTFNVPDRRGRVSAGKDDMGGVAANRLTNQSGGVDGDTLGAVGGAETHALASAQGPQHTHVATFTGTPMSSHTHGIEYDGKRHGANGASFADTLNYVADGDQLDNSPDTFEIDTQGASAGTPAGTISVANSGSGTAHNNVQPTAIDNIIIYAGV